MKQKNNKQQGTFIIIAALIVLFSSMWNPWISVIVSIIALIIVVIWEFLKK